MSGVDVLSVLDGEAKFLSRFQTWVNEYSDFDSTIDAQIAIENMEQARAAVAELIRAAESLLAAASTSAVMAQPFVVDSPGIVATRAALAACRGKS